MEEDIGRTGCGLVDPMACGSRSGVKRPSWRGGKWAGIDEGRLAGVEEGGGVKVSWIGDRTDGGGCGGVGKVVPLVAEASSTTPDVSDVAALGATTRVATIPAILASSCWREFMDAFESA